MVGHRGGATSKHSSDLNKSNRQLKSGNTLKGCDLKGSRRMRLVEVKQTIVAQMQQANEDRHEDRHSERMNNIKEHTTPVCDRTTEKTCAHFDKTIAALVGYFSGGGLHH